MTEKLARKLVDDYIKGWKSGNAKQILSPLLADCFITESHGPTYRGVEQVKRWIEEWLQTGKVNKWDVDSFFFTKNTAFLEWSFACSVDGKKESIEGASVVQFKHNKIYHIHEYRMTKPAFDYFKSST